MSLIAGALALSVGLPGPVVGCGDDEETGEQTADRPAKPPPGYRTVRNEVGGFTLAAPRSWSARSRERITKLRSPGRLVVMTIGADRSSAGRDTPPTQYARQTLESLPGLEGTIESDGEKVSGSPYGSALVEGQGTLETSPRIQRIRVAALNVPGQVTIAATIFGLGNPRTVSSVLASVRAAKPASP